MDEGRPDPRERRRRLARALAWSAGHWGDRLLLEAVLRAPETLPVLLAEDDLEP
ncbi:hypothetical protein ACFQY7_47155 [Actinomadura luteofluorescens]|uniref:hypothetical protein n=1 Tax=Actinomadura luteofluorescens TaxID=46163 RepID=UPI0036358D03